MHHSKDLSLQHQELERAMRQDLGDNVVQPVPGILMSKGDLDELLAEDQSAEALFRYFWEIGYCLEEEMRGGWTATERQRWAAQVAHDALAQLFVSRPGKSWTSGYCLLLEKPDGTIEPYRVNGTARQAVGVMTEPSVFKSAFSSAQAEARKAWATVQPTPSWALLIFGARAPGDRILGHYHQFRPGEIETSSTPQQPLSGEEHQSG